MKVQLEKDFNTAIIFILVLVIAIALFLLGGGRRKLPVREENKVTPGIPENIPKEKPEGRLILSGVDVSVASYCDRVRGIFPIVENKRTCES